MTYVGLYLSNNLFVCSESLRKQSYNGEKGVASSAEWYKPQIGVLGGKEMPGLALSPSEPGAYGLGVDNMLNSTTDEASATSDKDD
jgi:hypothetical protein